MGRGRSDLIVGDELCLLVAGNMVLVAILGSIVLLCPSGITIFLCQPVGIVFETFGYLTSFDLCILLPGVSLSGYTDEGGIDNGSFFGEDIVRGEEDIEEVEEFLRSSLKSQMVFSSGTLSPICNPRKSKKESLSLI